jgi:hypothetical protein
MKVKCKIDSLQKAKDKKVLNDDIEYVFSNDFNHKVLKLGKFFEVHAILLTSKGIWLFILEDDDDDFPKHYPLCFFDIVDANIPANWVVGSGHHFEYQTRKVFALLSHPIWAEDKIFFENLVNGDKNTIKDFKKNFIITKLSG